MRVSEVYAERSELAVAVRVDGRKPLARRAERGQSGRPVFRELLFSGFVPTREQEGTAYTAVAKRITEHSQNGNQAPELGQKVKAPATVEDLIFDLSEEAGAADPERKQGVVDVLVFEVVADKIIEVIQTPVSQAQAVNPLFSPVTLLEKFQGTVLKGGAMRSYQPGKTTFGEPVRKSVSLTTISNPRIVAGFSLLLVGEDPQAGLEMTEAADMVNSGAGTPENA